MIIMKKHSVVELLKNKIYIKKNYKFQIKDKKIEMK